MNSNYPDVRIEVGSTLVIGHRIEAHPTGVPSTKYQMCSANQIHSKTIHDLINILYRTRSSIDCVSILDVFGHVQNDSYAQCW